MHFKIQNVDIVFLYFIITVSLCFRLSSPPSTLTETWGVNTSSDLRSELGEIFEACVEGDGPVCRGCRSMKWYSEGCGCLKVMGRAAKLFSKVNFSFSWKRDLVFGLLLRGGQHIVWVPENSNILSSFKLLDSKMQWVPRFFLILPVPVSLMTPFWRFFHCGRLLFVVRERFSSDLPGQGSVE